MARGHVVGYEQVIRRNLHDNWTLEPLGGPFPDNLRGKTIKATVPGVVHTDLLDAGLIADPLDGSNEDRLLWIGQSSWRYRTAFVWSNNGSERHDLVFEGLDTVASVWLNGTLLGETFNQHRTFRFDAREALVQGNNELVVEFASAHDYISTQSQLLGERPKIYPHSFALIRKAACNFGWDWGPDVTTAGVWRAVRLESWSSARIAAVRPTADASGRLRVSIDLEHSTAAVPVDVCISIAETTVRSSIASSGVVEVEVEDPELWWPRGFGDQALYALTVSLESDTWQGNVGFRTIKVDNVPDVDGRPFEVYINGSHIKLYGANWIPDDVFPSRMSSARYERALMDACEANMNTVRVWGGGIFESDDFYDLCDKLGLLVWQDFLFACAAYPEEEPLWSEITAETEDAINRLAHHPSLMLWNGSNENIWGMSEWGWNEIIGDVSWGEKYYTELLPSIVSRLDPARQYIPSSPFSWEASDQNAEHDGLIHLWDVWNTLDYTHYSNSTPRFASEFGIQGAACERTLLDSLDERPLVPTQGQLAHHQKAIDGVAKMERSYRPHLPEPTDFASWVFTTQLNQAQGLRYAINTFRTQRVSCGGILIWQLNDCWPAISWSLIDHSGRRKPAWYAVRDSFVPVVTQLTEDSAVLVNNAVTPSQVKATLSRYSLDGALITRETITLDAGPGEHDRAELDVAFKRSPDTDGVVLLDSSAGRSYRLDREIRDSALKDPNLVITTRPAENGNATTVSVTTDVVVVDLVLCADKIGPQATVDTALVTLVPGETHVFTVRSASSVSEEVARGALMSANHLLVESNTARSAH